MCAFPDDFTWILHISCVSFVICNLMCEDFMDILVSKFRISVNCFKIYREFIDVMYILCHCEAKNFTNLQRFYVVGGISVSVHVYRHWNLQRKYTGYIKIPFSFMSVNNSDFPMVFDRERCF